MAGIHKYKSSIGYLDLIKKHKIAQVSQKIRYTLKAAKNFFSISITQRTYINGSLQILFAGRRNSLGPSVGCSTSFVANIERIREMLGLIEMTLHSNQNWTLNWNTRKASLRNSSSQPSFLRAECQKNWAFKCIVGRNFVIYLASFCIQPITKSRLFSICPPTDEVHGTRLQYVLRKINRYRLGTSIFKRRGSFPKVLLSQSK